MSGNTSGALGFVQGLMGGMEFSDDRRRKKAVDNLLDQKKYLNDLDVGARKKDFLNEGGDLSEWPEFDNPANADPLLVRGFNYLKKKFGYGSKDGTEPTAGLTESAESTDKPHTGFTMSGFADGGKVDDEEERLKRSYGDNYVTEEEAAANREYQSALPPAYQSPYSPYMRERRGRTQAGRTAIPTDGGGASEVLGDVTRAGADTFDDTISAGSKGAQGVLDALDSVGEAEGVRGKAGAVRDVGLAGAKAIGTTALGLAKDVFLDNPYTQGVLGFYGWDGREGDRQPDPNTPPPSVGTEKKQAIDATVGDGASDKQVADKAVSEAVKMTPGHPDNPDQAFNWAEVAASGVTPEDLPPAHTDDWAKYRKNAAQAEAMRGGNVQAKMDEITKMQINGFSANMMQSAFLLKQGDTRGAALAARMAYQYFPNGSDVRFGVAEGKNGPILVGMGTDEKTGEAVGDGTPMVLTPDTLAMYADSAKDPQRWLAWTKDWHEMARKDREYNEITVPKEEQAMRTDRAREEALYAGAEKDRAYVRSGGGSGKDAPKQSDFRASLKEMGERLFGVIDAEDLIAMEATAERVRQAVPDVYELGDAQIVDMVLKAYESDDFSQIQELLKNR